MKAIKGITYFRWKVNICLEKFEKDDFYFKKEMAVVVLEKLMGYQVEWERNENKTYVDGTVMLFARLDAGIGFELTTMDTEGGRGGQRQTLY